MNTDVLIAIISGLLPLIGVVITVNHNDKKNAKRSQEQTELTLYRIGELEKKQDKYNHLQERVCKLEKHEAENRSDILNIMNRISDLHNG